MSVGKVGTGSVIMLQNSEEQLAVELGGDTNAQMAAMMLKHGSDRRTATRHMRHQEEKHLEAMEAKEVSKLREQAREELVAARQKAVGKMVGGALGITSGVVGGCFEGKGAEYAASSLKASQSGVEGASEYVAAGSADRASQAQIASKEASNKAEEAKRRMEDLKDDEQSAREIVRSAVDFLKNITQGKADVERAALFNRV
ncbi:MAG: hypothetical protein KC776_42305 [Myxococcales bacterium]|nr:hypothetical protein [Myxococcales bacterium]